MIFLTDTVSDFCEMLVIYILSSKKEAGFLTYSPQVTKLSFVWTVFGKKRGGGISKRTSDSV
jgi:hypothetical protein